VIECWFGFTESLEEKLMTAVNIFISISPEVSFGPFIPMTPVIE
jgi:hypothetical protein